MTVWVAAQLDRLLDDVIDVEAARAHRIGPLVATRLRSLGREVPAELAYEERLAMLVNVTATALLKRLRDVLDGPLMVFKGPEIARLYPERARFFGDLDILVPDALRAQEALLAAGFVEVPDPDGIFVGLHHLVPVTDPKISMLAVEVHSEPKWPYGLRPPAASELFAAAIDSSAGIDGVLAPAPEHHAVLLAAHAWDHEPLRYLRDVLDVALAKEGLQPAELARVARDWGVREIWETTRSVADALIHDAREPWSLRIWARHLAAARERTVLENHLERWLSALWGRPFRDGARRSLRRIGDDFRPAFDETWPEKIGRTALALLHALLPRSRHDRLLGKAAEKGQRRNPPPQQEPGS